ncbi:MAG: hypothetical protein Q9N32_06250 [Gammaproteobacteria bacterium]|nr:hypothetical protein [Gammaproteobacteria bacterium]
MRNGSVFFGLILFGFGTCSFADNWQQCDSSNGEAYLPTNENSESAEVDLKADNAQLVKNGVSVFTGDVIVTRGAGIKSR